MNLREAAAWTATSALVLIACTVASETTPSPDGGGGGSTTSSSTSSSGGSSSGGSSSGNSTSSSGDDSGEAEGGTTGSRGTTEDGGAWGEAGTSNAGGDSGAGSNDAGGAGDDAGGPPMSCNIAGGTPPPAGNAWNTTPEPSINDSYIRSVFATLEEAACTFELVVYGTKPDMYNQSVYIRKRDSVAPGSCQEPKGWFNAPRVSDHDREKAGALLVRHPRQANMLLYAFSGRSINWFLEAGVFLIDSVTGRQLHPGKLTASSEPHWGQRWTPLAAEFPGCDLVVHWKGIVNGATGANTGFVRSELFHFIAPQVQPSALPDVLVYE